MLHMTLIILCVLYVAYILGGAALFMVIEPRTRGTKISLADSEVFKKFVEDNPGITSDAIKTFSEDLIVEYEAGKLTNTNTTDRWTFDESIFFVVTVITTIGFGNIYPVTTGGNIFFYALHGIPLTAVVLIGFGNIYPVTTGGKIFFFFYALHGIPLTAVVLIGLGERIVKPYNAFERRRFTEFTKCELYTKRAITLMSTYTMFSIIPAVVFSHVEGWTFVDAWYFTMVTLTTVGFGDLIPIAGLRGDTTSVIYKVVIGLWVFFGLAWLSCVLSVISNHMTDTSKAIDSKITDECEEIKRIYSKKERQETKTLTQKCEELCSKKENEEIKTVLKQEDESI